MTRLERAKERYVKRRSAYYRTLEEYGQIEQRTVWAEGAMVSAAIDLANLLCPEARS